MFDHTSLFSSVQFVTVTQVNDLFILSASVKHDELQREEMLLCWCRWTWWRVRWVFHINQTQTQRPEPLWHRPLSSEPGEGSRSDDTNIRTKLTGRFFTSWLPEHPSSLIKANIDSVADVCLICFYAASTNWLWIQVLVLKGETVFKFSTETSSSREDTDVRTHTRG